jgi:hypothetical protein
MFLGHIGLMNAADFDRHLRLELCWLDGVPTAASHAGQRQCPHCRRKWSYAVLRRQWLIAREFCKGSNRRTAAKAADADVHTAGRHYKRFQELLAPHFVELAQRRDEGIFADPERLADACRQAMKTLDLRKRFLLVVALYLAEMPAESRLELVYRLAFRERSRALIRSALDAQMRRKPHPGPH